MEQSKIVHVDVALREGEIGSKMEGTLRPEKFADKDSNIAPDLTKVRGLGLEGTVTEAGEQNGGGLFQSKSTHEIRFLLSTSFGKKAI